MNTILWRCFDHALVPFPRLSATILAKYFILKELIFKAFYTANQHTT